MPDDAQKTTVQTEGPDGGAGPSQPGQDPTDRVAAVPAPGSADSSAGSGVRTAQGASPEESTSAGDEAEGSDAESTSAGAWTAIAAPGKPDGEVDTRS